MKNKLSKHVNECSFKIDILKNLTSNEIRNSKRNGKAKDFGANFYIFLLENKLETYSEVMTAIKASFLKETVKDKMNSLFSNKT